MLSTLKRINESVRTGPSLFGAMAIMRNRNLQYLQTELCMSAPCVL